MITVPSFEVITCYAYVCLCLVVVSGHYSCPVKDAGLQANAFYRTSGFLSTVVSLQYCIVVPFNKCFHVLAATVTNTNSVSVE